MSAILKYNLEQINNIAGPGFVWELSEETIQTINYLCSEVGAPPVTSNIF